MNQPTAMTAMAGDAATTRRPAAAMAAGRSRPVGQRTDNRVGDQPGDSSHAHHHGQQDRVGSARDDVTFRNVVVQRLHLLGQQHLERRVDGEPEPDVGEEEQPDPAPPDGRRGFRQGRMQRGRGLPAGRDGFIHRCLPVLS
jgi:hypothetical protein